MHVVERVSEYPRNGLGYQVETFRAFYGLCLIGKMKNVHTTTTITMTGINAITAATFATTTTATTTTTSIIEAKGIMAKHTETIKYKVN